MSETNSIDVRMIHDLLLDKKPSKASHDASRCPLCVASDDGSESHTTDDTLGGDVSTITQDDIDKAVAEATADLRAQLEEMKQEQGLAEFETRLSEMTEAHEAKVAELQAEIDTAKASAEAAQAQYSELTTLIEEAQAAEEAAAALTVRTEEIKEAVASLFSEEHVAANIDRWAALEPEAFESALADWTDAAEAAKKVATPNVDPAKAQATAMQINSEEPEGERSVADIRRDLHTRGEIVRTVGASYTGGNA